MPLGVLGGAALGVGINAASNIIGGFTQEYFNRRQHSTQISDYQMMRQDALNDWNRETQYNSPAAMVQRLKDANISPYALAGSSFVASQPSVRPTSMSNNTTPYQVNSATNAFSIVQGLEQVKAMRLDNEKREVDIQNARQDLQSKTTDNTTLPQRRSLEIEQMARNLSLSDASISEKTQQVENLKAQLKRTLIETKLAGIESVYRSQFLSGRNALQQVDRDRRLAEIRHINKQIDTLDIHNAQDVAMFPKRVELIQAQIQGTKLVNEGRKLENVYLPTHLANREIHEDVRNATDINELEFLKTLSPEARFWLDKLGGLGGDILKGAARGFMKK